MIKFVPLWRERSVERVVLCDLDGVVWLAHEPINGSVDAIERLRRAGIRVLFVTNNSASTTRQQEEALARIGITADGDVLTSAHAAACLTTPGQRALVCGGPGITEALTLASVEAIELADVRGCRDAPDVDLVVVGFHRDFDYESMRIASAAIRRGARLIGTNDDATYPTPDGPIPGGGSIVAAVAAAAETTPVFAGKPHEAMAGLVRSTVGAVSAEAAVMVGDRPDTDGRFAETLACAYAIVWSGVTPAGALVAPRPDLTGDNLAAIADQLEAI